MVIYRLEFDSHSGPDYFRFRTFTVCIQIFNRNYSVTSGLDTFTYVDIVAIQSRKLQFRREITNVTKKKKKKHYFWDVFVRFPTPPPRRRIIMLGLRVRTCVGSLEAATRESDNVRGRAVVKATLRRCNGAVT